MKKTPSVLKVVDAGIARDNAAALIRYIAAKKIVMRGDGRDAPSRLATALALKIAIAALRALHARVKAVEVRHLIFSAGRGLSRRQAIRQLFLVFRDWHKKYAADRAWVAGIHFHDGGFHLHAAVQNVRGGRALKFRPHQVKSMAEMEFTEHAVSARGTGRSRAVSVYPHAAKLTVRDLAARLVATDGTIKKSAWASMKSTREVRDFRLRKDGSIVSFECDGHRIRMTTLARFVERRQAELSPEIIAVPRSSPAKSAPESMRKPEPISKSSPALLAAINAQLRALSGPRPRKTKNKKKPAL